MPNCRCLRQQPGRADIREVADPGLGHCQPGALGHNAVAAMSGNPDAAAHDDAVHDGDIGLAVAGDAAVDDELLAPELSALCRALTAAFIDHADIAAGAEPALALARDNHGRNLRIVLEFGQRRCDQPDHRDIETVECARAVQPDPAYRPLARDDHFRCWRLHFHERSSRFWPISGR